MVFNYCPASNYLMVAIIAPGAIIKGHGKRGGARSIIAYKAASRTFFIFGYAKNERSNMTTEERKIAKTLAAELLSYSAEQLDKLVKDGKLMEVEYHAQKLN